MKRQTIGRISVNGKVVKPSYEVKVGDIVEIKFGENWSKFEILRVSEVVRKDDATEMYKLL